jgi:hypothetical protein
LENGLKKYTPQVRSGIKCKNKEKSDLTVSFELYKDEKDYPIST